MTLTRRAVLGGFSFLHPHVAAASRPTRVPSYAEKFEAAFQPGFSFPFQLTSSEPLQPVPFQVIDGGELLLPSGQIVACDPFVSDDRAAFTQQVPEGRARLRFSHPLVHGEHGGRVAFARLDFSQAKVTQWEMALIPGQDNSILKDDEIFGYPVDAGTGCFGDREAFAALRAATANDPGLTEAWIAAGETAGRPLGLSYYLEQPMGRANIIMFPSGWGDGFYASYFGYDAAGDVTALLTDFNVIDWAALR
jgi:hypothetical protein